MFRLVIVIALVLLPGGRALAQNVVPAFEDETLEEKRKVLLDTINYFRAAPADRVWEVLGIKLSPGAYPPNKPYIMDKKLNRSAQRWAKNIVRTGKYRHSRMPYSESVAGVQNWQGGYRATVALLIIDKYVPSKGHRKHMLRCKDKYIGIGIARGKYNRETFICIQTR